MRLAILFAAVLTVLPTSVLAAIVAAPYEALYFYFAYKLQWAATGGDPTKMTIGWSCQPAPCDFNDFVRNVYDETTIGSFEGFTPEFYVNDNSPATLDAAARALADPDVGFTTQRVTVETNRLIRGLPAGFGYNGIINRVSQVVTASASAGGNLRTWTAQSLNGIWQERYAAGASARADHMSTWFSSNVAEGGLEVGDCVTPGGTDYKDFNWDATMDKFDVKPGTDVRRNIEAQFNTERTNWENQQRDVHWPQIRNIQVNFNKVFSTCG